MFSPAPQDGRTPLHRASLKGHLKVVEALLANGADLHTKSDVSIARACAPCPSRSLTHTQYAHGNVPVWGIYSYVCLSCCLSRRRFGCKA